MVIAKGRTAAADIEPVVRQRISAAPAVLFVGLTACYVAISWVLTVRYNLFDGDGPSRVAHAGFAVMSRDPHLSAIGFVWNPLPSLVEIPLLPLHRWWPELKTHGMAGAFQSAAFMAGSALMIRRIAIDRRVERRWRWIAVAAFAFHPMVLTYGGSGLSEAAEIFCVLWCIRHLLRWFSDQRIGDLAWAGIALGVGYLARYEMVLAALGAAVLVAWVSLLRCSPASRRSATLLNVLVVLFPLSAAFIAWALAGWVLTGQAFSTLSSQYGNASQVATSLARQPDSVAVGSDSMMLAVRTLAMQPLTGIAAALAVVLSVARRRIEGVLPLATLGAILAFSLWGAYTETTFGWFRYYLPAVPMVIVVGLLCWAPGAGIAPRRLGAVLLSASLLVGIPVTAVSMLNPDIGNHQLQFGLNSLLDPQRYPADEQWYRRVGVDDRILAGYLDDQNLPDGSVLMDTFMNWGVWLASDRPRQFLIDTDFDYLAALNRPWDFGVQYILVTNPRYNAAPDSVITRYPTMWADGAGIGVLAHSAEGAFRQEQWRLYRVVEPASAELAQPGG
jgi:hypothetical protein